MATNRTDRRWIHEEELAEGGEVEVVDEDEEDGNEVEDEFAEDDVEVWLRRNDFI